MKSALLGLLSLLVILVSCRKDSFTSSPDARVSISADTLKFDTVFVTAGSTYQTLKVINENNQKLRVSLKLMGGNASLFKINVDGVSGTQFNNLEINADDSLYLFAQVNIDPNITNLPFVIRDSIELSYNGRTRLIQLEAWGQNANFFRNKIITANETWNNNLPYVILGSLHVNANQVLTINKGCRIYVHADAPIIINGTLQINGLKDSIDRVYFQGDRLDEPYRNFPASWPGIYFQTSSKDNVFNYAVIRNAYEAISLINMPPNANPKLILNECIIDNAYNYGILGYNSSLRARNCLVSNCGQNLFLLKGGDYHFTHSTVVTYANRYIDHRQPVLLLANYETVNNVNIPANLDASFRNCIFWGENGLVENEVVVVPKVGNLNFNVNFQNVLWKVTTPPNVPSSGIIANQHPEFDSVNTFRTHYNFRLKPTSPAVNAGMNAGVNIDLDGKTRPLGTAPDLGSYEKQ